MSQDILAKEIDKTGAEVTIKWVQNIGDSPIVPFFLRNYSELIDNGHALPFIMGTNSSKAVYAEVDGELAGHIIFEYQQDVLKTAWIIFSCVEAKYRQRGIYALMHKHFESVVAANGSKKIASHVHVTNTARQESCKSVGMQPVFYRMEKKLT